MTNHVNMTCEGGNLAASGFNPRFCSGKNLFRATAFGRGGCLHNPDVTQSNKTQEENSCICKFRLGDGSLLSGWHRSAAGLVADSSS